LLSEPAERQSSRLKKPHRCTSASSGRASIWDNQRVAPDAVVTAGRVSAEPTPPTYSLKLC
jgi:hypothetical protein